MSTGTTTVRSLPYPLSSDAPVVSSDIQALAQALDKAALIGVGTLANRPTPVAPGNLYFVQGDSTLANNGVYWIDTGTSWVALPTFGPPIGAVQSYLGTADPVDPDGVKRWMIGQGQAISRTTYAALFALISTTFGAGDGSTTFNLPNLALKFLLGSGSGYAFGKTGGSMGHQHSVPSLSASVSVPSVGVTVNAHSHSLSGNGAAEISIQPYSTGAYAVFQNTGKGISYGGFRIADAGGNNSYVATPATEASAVLAGSTDSDGASGYTAATGASGSTGTGTSGAADPPYIVLNHIIRVA